jgi:two-component system OmpR family response regulator
MSRGEKSVVLVADDDAALRMLCRVNLELDGYDVLEAASQQEVETAVAGNEIALVLLDVHLGVDDGIALARSLRARYPDLPIVFFSGSVSNPVGNGVADGMITKPFTLEELGDVARRLVPGRPAPPP